MPRHHTSRLVSDALDTVHLIFFKRLPRRLTLLMVCCFAQGLLEAEFDGIAKQNRDVLLNMSAEDSPQCREDRVCGGALE